MLSGICREINAVSMIFLKEVCYNCKIQLITFNHFLIMIEIKNLHDTKVMYMQHTYKWDQERHHLVHKSNSD